MFSSMRKRLENAFVPFRFDLHCRHFTPAWFAVNMGTGITSILLYTFPFREEWLGTVACILFALNCCLFFNFIIMCILRYMMYPELWMLMLTHPTESMFLGTFPMGLATIINMMVLVLVPRSDDWVAWVTWGIWIFDAIVSVLTAVVIPYIVTAHANESPLQSMTAAWLLPIVACVVAASSGAMVADVLPHIYCSYWTVLVSYMLWAIGVSLALMVMTIYLQRIMLHGLPPQAAIGTVFLPIGPLGQGGFGISKLGVVSEILFEEIEALDHFVGRVFYDVGLFVALMMWSFGLVWIFFAFAAFTRSERGAFNLGLWALTFPLGVFANCTVQLGDELSSHFFWVVGMLITGIVCFNWLMVSCRTIKAVYNGTVFVSPAVKDYEAKQTEDTGRRSATDSWTL